MPCCNGDVQRPWPTLRKKWQIFLEAYRRSFTKEVPFELGWEEKQCRTSFRTSALASKNLSLYLLLWYTVTVWPWDGYLILLRLSLIYLSRLFWKLSGIKDIRITRSTQYLIDKKDKAGNEEQQSHQGVSRHCAWGKLHVDFICGLLVMAA